MALIENIQREDLNPLEEAQGLKRLVDEFGLTHEAAAQAVGRSRSAASNLLRLLNLARAGAADADGGRPRHGPCARAAGAGARRSRSSPRNQIVAQKLSVRDAEKLVARTPAQGGRQTPLLRVKQGQTARHHAAGRGAGRQADRLGRDPRAAHAARAANRARSRSRSASLDELNGLLDKLGVTER